MPPCGALVAPWDLELITETNGRDRSERNSGSTVLNPRTGAGPGDDDAKRPPPWPRTGFMHAMKIFAALL